VNPFIEFYEKQKRGIAIKKIFSEVAENIPINKGVIL